MGISSIVLENREGEWNFATGHFGVALGFDGGGVTNVF